MGKHKKETSRQRRQRRRTNLHHIIAKSHRGKATKENLLRWDVDKHNLYHKLWGNKSFLEVIELLTRCLRMKNHPDYPEAQYLLDEYLSE